MMRDGLRWGLAAGLVASALVVPCSGTEPVDETARANAAVALNYSRAAFHRIRRNPSVRVLWEEQDKILNHLNLNGVADEEVIKLYSAVLDEIAQIQLGEREKELLREKYRRQFQRDVTLGLLGIGAQVATAQYATAVRTGATSWWDFRSQTQSRELDVWRVDKDRTTRLVSKSSQFLDISWKMARNKQIPDRWLVRGDDLDKLEEAWNEPDPAVRLRVLKRMEPFLEKYPPYWYYVARTQQAQGQLFAAAETYEQLANLGQGHFRKDEMLACGLANRALIQAYLSQPGAPETALRALAFSTDVWEANLLCGVVLQQHRRYVEAEDAILRNLDVGLERPHSQQTLIGVYYASDNRQKLAQRLSDPAVARELPPPLLLLCAGKLGAEATPPAVAQLLERSLQIAPRFNLGRDDLVVQAAENWQLAQTQLKLTWGDKTYDAPRWATTNQTVTASFDGVAEFGPSFNSANEPRELTLTVQSAGYPPIRMTLQLTGVDPASVETAAPLAITNRRYPVYKIAAYEQDQLRVSVQNGTLRLLAGTNPAPINNGAGGLVKGSDAARTVPTGSTTLKPVVNDDPYLVTPPIEIPIVPPTR